MKAKSKNKSRNSSKNKSQNTEQQQEHDLQQVSSTDDRSHERLHNQQQQQQQHSQMQEACEISDVEQEESNIVINLGEDEDDDYDQQQQHQNGEHQSTRTTNHFQQQDDNNNHHHGRKNSKLIDVGGDLNHHATSMHQQQKDDLQLSADLSEFAPNQLVWFDPNLFGYSIPGKIVDFHPELNLLTVEAYSQPRVDYKPELSIGLVEQMNDQQQENQALIELYKLNWLDSVLGSELQLYQLSELSQLACLKKRAPLTQSSGSADLVRLPEISTESIVWNLKHRSSQGLVYTNCGSQILISVNPNEQVPEMYNLDQVNCYDANQASKLASVRPTSSSALLNSQLFRWLLLSYNENNNTKKENPQQPQQQPHIFAMARDAMRQLLISGQDQCFVLLGECGSGKSEASKLLVQYFAAINKAPSNRLTEQILESQQILESFGNAARRQNSNSSRFAKLITLNVNLETGLLTSAYTNDLKLLDKSRIVGQQGVERNYHIFYELVAGLKQQERERYGLQQAEKYFYLNQGTTLELAQKDDAEDFRSLLSSMQVLGFTQEEQDTCFRLLASILHLGNIYFHRRLLAIKTGKLANLHQKLDQSSASETNSQSVEGVEIGSDTEVRWISHLLQIQFESVMQCLSMRTTESNQPQTSSKYSSQSYKQQQQQSIIKDKIVTPLNIDQALDARDALARALYTCLFRWLLERLNAATGTRREDSKQHHNNSSSMRSQTTSIIGGGESLCEFQPDKLLAGSSPNERGPKNGLKSTTPEAAISILDCFGFENLSENYFEQLCINLSAELLQHHTRRFLIKLELIEYERERLNWKPSHDLEWAASTQSAALVNLLARKPLGILPLLDDECNFPKGTDLTFMEKCHHNHALNKNYIRSQRDEDKQGIACEFGIRHFGNPNRIVYYQSDGFIEKNRDQLRPDLVELVQSSSSPLIKSMMSKFLQQTPASSTTTNTSDSSQRTLTRTHDGRYVSMKPRQTTVSARFQEALTSNRVLELLNPSAKSPQTPTITPTTTMDGSIFYSDGNNQHQFASFANSQTTTSPFPLPPNSVWFLICIRANRIQASAKLFDVAFVQEQVNCLDLLELVVIRKMGFPYRLRYQDFVRRYQCLAERCQISLAEASRHKRTLRDLSLDILELSKRSIGKEGFQFGLTKVFLSEPIFHHLEKRRLDRYQDAIEVMQKMLRMWLARRKFLCQRSAACIIQAHMRAYWQRIRYRRQLGRIIFIQRRWRQIMLQRRHQRLEAKRKAKRAQQLAQLQELQAQHARKQASQFRFRQQQQHQQQVQQQQAPLNQQMSQQQLAIPDDLAQLYRALRNWTPPNDLSKLENHYNQWSLAELEDQERKRSYLLFEKQKIRDANNQQKQQRRTKTKTQSRLRNNQRNKQRNNNGTGSISSLLSVPFLALIDAAGHRQTHSQILNHHNINSDHHEILAQILSQFRHELSTRLAADLQLATSLNELENRLINSNNWDDQYSLNLFVDKYYPIEAPQFGYSRCPITKPFTWHKLRHLHANWLRNAPSRFVFQQISARFEQLKSQPIIMYKLILRYIDSNHDYATGSANNNKSLSSYHHDNDEQQAKSNGPLSLIAKFKLLADYLIVLCLQEPLLRPEFYLQLASLSWQNPKLSSQNNLWKLMLNCLACFGPDDEELICFLMQYVNDYCLSKQHRTLLLSRLAIWLVKKILDPINPNHDQMQDVNDAILSSSISQLSSSIINQRLKPGTLVEYLAHDKLVSKLLLPVSAFMDDHNCRNDMDGNDDDDFERRSFGGYNFSMRTLVELRPTDAAELVARRALEVRQVPLENLAGWSLEIQHQAGALSDFSCRLRGDESPLDHLSRIEMLPQLLEMVESSPSWALNQDQGPAGLAEARLSAAYSIASTSGGARIGNASIGDNGIRHGSRRLSVQSQLTNATTGQGNRFSCCSTGSWCNQQNEQHQRFSSLGRSVDDSQFGRGSSKRRNSSSGVWSTSTFQNTDMDYASEQAQSELLNGTSDYATPPQAANHYDFDGNPLPDYDDQVDQHQQQQQRGRVMMRQNRPSDQFRHHRRSRSVQNITLESGYRQSPLIQRMPTGRQMFVDPYASGSSYEKQIPIDNGNHYYAASSNSMQQNNGAELKGRRRNQSRRLNSASSLQQINKLSMAAGYGRAGQFNKFEQSITQPNHDPDWDLTDNHQIVIPSKHSKIINSDQLQRNPHHQKLSSGPKRKNQFKEPLPKNQQYPPSIDYATTLHHHQHSSAMSDTSEAPSLASHVRHIEAPQNQGNQADVDRYLDDLFRPMLNEADLDELTDAKSLATSIKGLKGSDRDDPKLATSAKPEKQPEPTDDAMLTSTMDKLVAEASSDMKGEEGVEADDSYGGPPEQHLGTSEAARVLSPTFESLLRGLTDSRIGTTGPTTSSGDLGPPRSTTPSLETDLKSMNFNELKALNERLESEIRAARNSNSHRISSLINQESNASQRLLTFASGSIPEPPPQPNFCSPMIAYDQSSGLSEDIYSRAKTIRIGKWRWPPAQSDLVSNTNTGNRDEGVDQSAPKDANLQNNNNNNEQSTDPDSKKKERMGSKDLFVEVAPASKIPAPVASSNVGRVKISSEMKAKLEQLTGSTTGSSSPKSSSSSDEKEHEGPAKIQIVKQIVASSSVQQFARQQQHEQQQKIRQISGNSQSFIPVLTNNTTGDRLSQELGASFNSSGKVLAAKQLLAAAAGLDLASLHSGSSNANSAGSSRRQSAQVLASNNTNQVHHQSSVSPLSPSNAMSKQASTNGTEAIVARNHGFMKNQSQTNQLADDELGPNSRAAVSQRNAFYNDNNNEHHEESFRADDLQKSHGFLAANLEKQQIKRFIDTKSLTKPFFKPKIEKKDQDRASKSRSINESNHPIINNNWVESDGVNLFKTSALDSCQDAHANGSKNMPIKRADKELKLLPSKSMANKRPGNNLEEKSSYQAVSRLNNLDYQQHNNNSNSQTTKSRDDQCLSYENINWQIRIRKEFFLPSESYDEPQVLQLLFTQLVADVFNPRQWTRLNTKERALIKTLMKEHSIGYSDRLPQMGELDDVKLELVRMARSFGLYFTRSYPAQNLACLANEFVHIRSNNDIELENFFSDWEALNLMRQLSMENRLGLVWIDMVALHHTGVRLVSVVGGGITPGSSGLRQPDESTTSSEKSQQQLGYKIIELLKYRDMYEIIALSSSELFLSMANGRRSWVLSMEQASKVASMLNWLLADYRKSRSERNNNGVVAAGAIAADQCSTFKQPVASGLAMSDSSGQGLMHLKSRNIRLGSTTTTTNGLANFNYSSSSGLDQQQAAEHFGEEDQSQLLHKQEQLKQKATKSISKKQQAVVGVVGREGEEEEQDALLASGLDSNVNRCEQRQIPSREPATNSLSPSNDVGASFSSNISHHRTKSNESFDIQQYNNSKQQQSSISDLGLGSSTIVNQNKIKHEQDNHPLVDQPLSACNSSLEDQNNHQLSSASSSSKKKHQKSGQNQSESSEETTTNRKRESNLSAWHSSLSRMSSRVSLFGGGGGAGKASTNADKRKGNGEPASDSAPHLARDRSSNNNNNKHKSLINRNDEILDDLNVTTSDQQHQEMSVAESMRLGLDTWIECKVVSNVNQSNQQLKRRKRDGLVIGYIYDLFWNLFYFYFALSNLITFFYLVVFYHPNRPQ